MNKSWRTSTLGVIAILSAIANAVKTALDGDPATNPDWPTLVTSITAGWGLLVARDNVVSSEQAGAIAMPSLPLIILLPFIALFAIGCASGTRGNSSFQIVDPDGTNAPPSVEYRMLRWLASQGANEALMEDQANAKVLREVSDALDVFCGQGKADSLFLLELVRGLPDRLKVSEKTKRRIGSIALLVEELGGNINPSDYVAWGGLGCAVREGIQRGLALYPTKTMVFPEPQWRRALAKARRKAKGKDKYKSAAVLTVFNAADFTPTGAKNIAKWLRDRANDIERHSKELSGRFRARYLYAQVPSSK